MLVGIGFVAILTAALAERFVASQVEEVQEDVVEEIEAAGEDVRSELRQIALRLQAVERRLSRS